MGGWESNRTRKPSQVAKSAAWRGLPHEFLPTGHLALVDGLGEIFGVEDVTYPGPMKWLLRAAGLVTIDLAAWLPTPCVEWSYYHTLLFATIFPVVYVAVAVLYKNFKQIHDGIDKAARSCARYLREQFCSRTNAQQVTPDPAPAPARLQVLPSRRPERNKDLTESLLYKNFKQIHDGIDKAARGARTRTNAQQVTPDPAPAPAPAPTQQVPVPEGAGA